MGMAPADQDKVGHQGKRGALHGTALAEPARLSKVPGQKRATPPGVAWRGALGQTAPMSQRPRITITQSQRLQLNLGLHASIRLLRADAAGLTRYLEEVAAENPALKLDPPPQPTPAEWLPRWTRVFAAPAEGHPEQAAAGPSLMAHVLAAIDHKLTHPADRTIAVALAEALEPTGWLGQPLSAIATRLRIKPREVEAVLRRLQEIDPPGLFARDLAECLRLQAQDDGVYDRTMAIILNHLDLLAAGDLDRLAALAKVSPAEIARRFRLIRAMNPKPGTDFDAMAAPRLREPDLVARRAASGWEVTLNRSSLPALRLVDPGTDGAADLAAAKAVQRMVEARNSTLLRVGRDILQRQIRALDKGPGALVPMTMADVADSAGPARKHRQPGGGRYLGRHPAWHLVAARAVQPRPRRGPGCRQPPCATALPRWWPPRTARRPCPMRRLPASSSKNGATVARRTVAKYRGLLKIPPAHRRRLR